VLFPVPVLSRTILDVWAKIGTYIATKTPV